MANKYAHKFTGGYGDAPNRDWLALVALLSDDQIKLGLVSLSAFPEWPPTLEQFKRLCVGIPMLSEVSRSLATNSTNRSQFDILVWTFIDSWRVKTMTTKESDKAIAAAYELAVQHVMDGKPLPLKPVAMLEQKEAIRGPINTERSWEIRAEIANMLGVKNASE